MQSVSYAVIMMLLSGLALAEPHDVFGTFATQEGSSHVKISDCDDGTPCGTVVWIDPASLRNGLTPETVKTRSTGEPVLGMTMLKGFERGREEWRGGTIYSPKADKEFSSRLKRIDDETLEVKGCVGFICQTQLWTALP